MIHYQMSLFNIRPEIADIVQMAIITKMDLLVSHSWGHFHQARTEVIQILNQMGDPGPSVERTPVLGIALVHSCLNNRLVIQQCKTFRQERGLSSFQFAIKWVPVDYWCRTDLEDMKRVIDTHLADYVKPDQTWGMVVKKHRFQRYHSIDIVHHLAQDVHRQVNLNKPDWIVRVDILGKETSIAFLKPDEIFSVG